MSYYVYLLFIYNWTSLYFIQNHCGMCRELRPYIAYTSSLHASLFHEMKKIKTVK